MRTPRLTWLAVAGLLVASGASAQTASRTVGSVTLVAELDQAFPGGLVVARLRSRSRLGTAYAVLDGRRSPFFSGAAGPRALVPIPAEAAAGTATLGFEIWTRWGRRQRIPLTIEIAPRAYEPRSVAIPETRRHLPSQPGVLVQSRTLLQLLRTLTLQQLWLGPFRPPVATLPVASFGAPQVWLGGSPMESLLDGSHGERHRGLDYELPVGSLVQSPAAGNVLFAGFRTLTGHTLVLDHGQGVVSLLAHLSRLDVAQGDRVEARAPLGLSGDSGVAYTPHLRWSVYVFGVAVDPRVFEALTD